MVSPISLSHLHLATTTATANARFPSLLQAFSLFKQSWVFQRDLPSNVLYRDIPSSTSKLKQLERLALKNNRLIGPIPSTLSHIPNLKSI
ncbi:hypothetical protein MRB53_035108 [Persea americana]|uniref:Uncharacterized protein n=1 Tax=Persea americana TaxID=3435 RepID=A0ACC2K3S2_PERAE|nr:hypothetical protein MRB53_035108 [Persea americana]